MHCGIDILTVLLDVDGSSRPCDPSFGVYDILSENIVNFYYHCERVASQPATILGHTLLD